MKCNQSFLNTVQMNRDIRGNQPNRGNQKWSEGTNQTGETKSDHREPTKQGKPKVINCSPTTNHIKIQQNVLTKGQTNNSTHFRVNYNEIKYDISEFYQNR